MYKKEQTFTIIEATKRVELYCDYQERCYQEVYRKLRIMHVSHENINSIIIHLIENNFLNEERFANTFVKGKFNIKNWGKVRLNIELTNRGIDKDTINNALKLISEEEYIDKFNLLAEKKKDSLNGDCSQNNKNKFINYLLYRGWEPYLVYEKANDFMN